MVEGRGCSGSREGISGEGWAVVREGKRGKVWLIDSKDVVGFGIVIGSRRIRAWSSVFRGRSGRLGGVGGNGSGRRGRVEVGELIVDIEVGRGAGVLLLVLLLLIVKSAEGVLALAGVTEGISEEGAGGVDRVWVKGVRDRMSRKMAEGLLLLLLLALLGPGGLGGTGVEMEALLADFWVRGVVEERHEESWKGRRRWRQERGRRGRIQGRSSDAKTKGGRPRVMLGFGVMVSRANVTVSGGISGEQITISIFPYHNPKFPS